MCIYDSQDQPKYSSTLEWIKCEIFHQNGIVHSKEKEQILFTSNKVGNSNRRNAEQTHPEPKKVHTFQCNCTCVKLTCDHRNQNGSYLRPQGGPSVAQAAADTLVLIQADCTAPVQDVSLKRWDFAVCVFHFSNNTYKIRRRIQFLLKFSQLKGKYLE